MTRRKTGWPLTHPWTVSLGLLWLWAAGTQPLVAQQRSMASRIEHSEKEPQNWLTFYGNYGGWSYSPLNQITRENVKQLVPAWAFSAGAPPASTTIRNGLEAAPLVADGVLYLEGMQNKVYAKEAATGRALWTYTYKWGDKPITGVKGRHPPKGPQNFDSRMFRGV